MTRAAIVACLVLAAGCAAPTAYESTPAYNKYTLEQVVAWSKEGQAPKQIIARLDAANAFFPLRASEILRLREEGVSPEVLDFILERYVWGVARDERFQFTRRGPAP
jgi:hypothetical protein